jgi:hypothetical protein
MSPGEAITLLRRIGAALIDAQHPDAPDFAARLAEYVTGAPHGVTLGQAFGLEGTGAPWWQLEQRQERDRLVRELAGRHFPGLPARAAARGLRRRPCLMELLRQTGAATGDRVLRQALGKRGRLPSAQAAGDPYAHGNRTRTPTRP